jgi:hypothetical protein
MAGHGAARDETVHVRWPSGYRLSDSRSGLERPRSIGDGAGQG